MQYCTSEDCDALHKPIWTELTALHAPNACWLSCVSNIIGITVTSNLAGVLWCCMALTLCKHVSVKSYSIVLKAGVLYAPVVA